MYFYSYKMAGTELTIFSGIPMSRLINSSEFSRDVSCIHMSPIINSFDHNFKLYGSTYCTIVVHKLVKVRYSSLDYYNVYTMLSLIPYNWLHLTRKNLVKFETTTGKKIFASYFYK